MLGSPKIPTWNSSGRPTGELGLIGGNVTTGKIEWYDGTSWLNTDGTPGGSEYTYLIAE